MTSRLFLLLVLLPLLLIGCVTPPPPPQMSAADHFHEGRRLYDQALYQPAIEAFDRAIDLNPNHADAYFWKGEAYNRLNAADQAITAYLDALRIQPGHGQANLELGKLYFARFQYVPAESHLKNAIDANPADPEGYFFLAELYAKQGLCKQPKDLYQKVLSLQPTFYDAEQGLKDVTRKNCAVARKSAPKPQYEKRDEFGGGARALRDDEW